MKFLLAILVVIAFLCGIAGLSVGRGESHAIEAILWILIAAVLLTGASIIEAIRRIGPR